MPSFEKAGGMMLRVGVKKAGCLTTTGKFFNLKSNPMKTQCKLYSYLIN